MMFLLAANRMARGYASFARLLISSFRMLADRGFDFCREPAAGERLDWPAAWPAVRIILLDRSPSMNQRGLAEASEAADINLGHTFSACSVPAAGCWSKAPPGRGQEIESPATILTLPETESASTVADLPATPKRLGNYVRTIGPD